MEATKRRCEHHSNYTSINMRLLTKTKARRGIKRENEVLIESNLRLDDYHKLITHKLNTIKDDYEPEKLKILEEFEAFCVEQQVKREKVLGELSAIQKMIEDKKEVYYGLIEKQDALEEKQHQLDEENKKLNLREAFVLDLEQKWRNKQ